jgi:glucan 1,3-beta-glucosidase
MEERSGSFVGETAPGTPLALHEGDRFLEQPRASFLDSNVENSVQSTPNNSSPLLVGNKPEANDSERDVVANPAGSRKRRLIALFLVGFGILAIVVLAVILPVYFKVIKPKQTHNVDVAASGGSGGSGSGPIGGGSGNPSSPSGATSGGNGSQIIADNGTTFTYINLFGGYWVYDPNDPFNNNARPNSWTPPLNASWDWVNDRIYG